MDCAETGCAERIRKNGFSLSANSPFKRCLLYTSKRESLKWPADLYLEGADQYRGWFQSSLLEAVAVRGGSPYKAVLTHGWTVDGEGKAMHKSLGNTVAPEDMIKKYGAEMVRLWVASSDYRVDVRVSEPIFKQLSDCLLYTSRGV